MSDILLFNQYFSSEEKSPKPILASLPINLLYLASYIKDKGLDCKIYELGILDLDREVIDHGIIRYGLSDKEIGGIIQKENPKIIGLGCMYSLHFADVVRIARLIKIIDPSVKIVLGGNHATVFCSSILNEQSFDFIVKGEGEITFYELCRDILRDRFHAEDIKGLVFRNNNGEIIVNQDREFVKDLDSFPAVDYSLVDIEKYADPIYKTPYNMRYPAIGIITSRGCPGRCVFCTVKAVWGRTWRGQSAERTVNEIELLNTKYGIQEFSFLDDTASLDKKRWLNICDEIINRKLNIRWTTPNGIAHWTLDENILKKMKDAGCYRITFGIESGNEQTREFIGKPYSLLHAEELIQYANNIGMWTICTNIIGFPFEDRQAINDTIRFAKESGTDFATFFLLSPNLASDVYSHFEKEGLLDIDLGFKDNQFDIKKYESMSRVLDDGGFPTKYFTADELKRLQIRAFRSFIAYRAVTYLNPLRLLRKIRSVEDFKYTLRLLLSGLKILVRSFFKKTTKGILHSKLK